MGVFVDQMVTRKRYLTEEELIELMALCIFLPGPWLPDLLFSVGRKEGWGKMSTVVQTLFP